MQFCRQFKRLFNFVVVETRGGSRIFSMGVDFQKKFENFVELFSRSTKLTFRALPKHEKDPVLVRFSAP